MYRPRVIPTLLLKGQGLVKTVNFNKETYIGDPINAVKIFNDLEVDELIFLDITATNENRTLDIELINNIGDEAFMPFAVGGGFKTINDINNAIKGGAEKVIINSELYSNKLLIKQASNKFGSQSIIVSIDIKTNIFGQRIIYSHSGQKKQKISLEEFVKDVQRLGAGEIMINSINKDGTMKGYDIELIKFVSDAVSIPVIACGGAGKLTDFSDAYNKGNASAVAAGSIFVYHGSRNAILINYPDSNELRFTFQN
tara:strand:- start:3883 stop:4647 length:765 start_codon:yes stop_codon:yes gene_type:complete